MVCPWSCDFGALSIGHRVKLALSPAGMCSYQIVYPHLWSTLGLVTRSRYLDTVWELAIAMEKIKAQWRRPICTWASQAENRCRRLDGTIESLFVFSNSVIPTEARIIRNLKQVIHEPSGVSRCNSCSHRVPPLKYRFLGVSSVITSTCCSRRGFRFNFWHPQGNS